MLRPILEPHSRIDPTPSAWSSIYRQAFNASSLSKRLFRSMYRSV